MGILNAWTRTRWKCIKIYTVANSSVVKVKAFLAFFITVYISIMNMAYFYNQKIIIRKKKNCYWHLTWEGMVCWGEEGKSAQVVLNKSSWISLQQPNLMDMRIQKKVVNMPLPDLPPLLSS
jgi:hypothetical protein